MNHSKRHKGSQKDFSLWMASETGDFFPTPVSDGTLEKFDNHFETRSKATYEVDLDEIKPDLSKSLGYCKYKANFDVFKYWNQLKKSFNSKLFPYFSPKDIMRLKLTCKYFRDLLDGQLIWN